MSVRCPNGHTSTATDYCDVCGAPLTGPTGGGGGADASAAGSPAGAANANAAGGGGSAGGSAWGVGASGATETGAAATTVLPSGPQTCPNCGTENAAEALFCEACGYDFTTGAMPRPVEHPAVGGPGWAPGPAAPAGRPTPEGPPTPEGSPTPGGPPAQGSPTPDGPPGAPPAPSGSPSPAGAPGSAGALPPLAPRVPLEWVVEVWVDPDWYAEQDGAEPCPSPGLPAIVPLAVRSVLVGRTSRSRNIHPDIACDTDIAVSRRHAQLTTDGTRWWVEDLRSANGTFVGPSSGPLPTHPIVPGQRRELAEDDRVYVGAWTRLVVRRATDDEKRTFG